MLMICQLTLLSIRRVANPRNSFASVFVEVCSFAGFFPAYFYFFPPLVFLHHLLHSHKILRHYQRYILECYCTYVSHLSFYMFFIALLHLYKFLCNYQRYNLECCYTCVCHLSFYMFFLVLLHHHFEMESMFQYSSCMCSLECSCIFCGTL